MNRHFAILVLVVNLFVSATGIRTVYKKRHHADPLPHTELKAGITNYLAVANAPEQMNDRSAEIANIMASADLVVEASHVLVYRYLKYLSLLGAFNVVFIGLGIWVARPKTTNLNSSDI